MMPATPTATLLIIDDEPDNLRLAVEMLRHQGFDMVSARDGAAGLQIAARLRPDLILLDICMPGMDGFEVCRRLKADAATRGIPVIFLTALDQFEEKSLGFDVGGVDYVTKPFDARELLLRVNSHLRLTRQLAELEDRLGGRTGQATDALVPAADAPDKPLATVIKARDVLLANLAEPPDLTTLARHCGTNRTSLQLLFRLHIGMTVFGYLREQRLLRARALLEQGGYTLDAAAEAVGYRNGRDLARAFKQRFGVAPGSLSRRTSTDRSAPGRSS